MPRHVATRPVRPRCPQCAAKKNDWQKTETGRSYRHHHRNDAKAKKEFHHKAGLGNAHLRLQRIGDLLENSLVMSLVLFVDARQQRLLHQLA